MSKALTLVYGIVVYVLFLVTFLYAIGFVANIVVPKSIDSGPVGALSTTLIIDLLLLGAFAIQHSVMARPAFKAFWNRVVPEAAERTTYVLMASLVLLLLFWQWRPLPGVVWSVDNGSAALLINVLCAVGWLQVLVTTFLIDHFDLFGLRQVWLHATGKEYAPPVFRETTLYRYVRHPLLLGFIVAFWATPRMTRGHLLFAVATTIYMLIAIRLEEHDLAAMHGDVYEDYRQRVSMIIPRPPRG